MKSKLRKNKHWNKKVKYSPKDREKIFDKLAPLIAEYLNACGFGCLLVGEKGISSEGDEMKYSVIFDFIGGKKSETKELKK